MRKIVCLSTSPWYPIPTRKQQVMSRLHNAEILYFDPPISVIAPFKDKSLKEKAKEYKNGGEKIRDGLYRYALVPVLPFFNKFRFINRINQRNQAKYITKIMKQHGFGDDTVLWCYSPTACDVYKYIPHRALVYDCVDRHSAYKGLINPAVVDRMEEDLARKCDMVYCTAEGLYDTLKDYNENCAMIPNGANYELFNRASSDDLVIPNEMKEIKKPILGFVGTMAEWIDYELIYDIAQRHPEWSFVFVGKEKYDARTEELHKLQNVHFLGAKPHNELPNYIKQFDVCLNIFKEGRLSKDVSPLKFYEYLATTKPIVSTRCPLQVSDFAETVYISDTVAEFEENIKKALNEKGDELKIKRDAQAKACSWDARVEQIEGKLDTLNI